MSDINMKIIISAADQASGVIRNVASSMGMGGLGGLIAGAAVAAVGFGAASVKMAADYQQSMNMVAALTGSNTQQMGYYNDQLMKLATNAGVAPVELSKGLYYVLSASYKGADAMNVLTLSTEDAKIGMTDQTTTANALTTVLKAFSIQSKDFTRVNGEMLQTVTLGKMTMADYAGSIGKASSTAMQYHVSMEDMNASIATMTSNGIPSAHQAVTDFTQAVSVMYANINTVSKSLNKQGIAFDEAKFNTLSYQDKIAMLNQALQEAAAKHIKVTGVTKQAAAAIQIISQHSKEFSSDLATLSDKQQMANATAQAWATTQGGFNQQLDRAKAALDVLMIDIGSAFLPVLTQFTAHIVPIIGQFTDWITKSGLLKQMADGLSSGLGDLMGMIESLTNPVTSCTNNFDAFHTIAKALHDLLPQIGTFLSDAGADIMGNLLPPLQSLISNTEDAVARFLAWLDTSGTAQGAMQALGVVIDLTSGLLGTMIGWVAQLVGWLGGGGAGTYTLVAVLTILAGAFLALKIADATSQFAGFVGKLQEGDGMIANIAASIKDKLITAVNNFLSNQAPNFKKSLDDFRASSQQAAVAEGEIGTAAETSAAEVTASSTAMEGDMAGVTATAGEAATATEGIGAAGATAGAGIAGGMAAVAGAALAAVAAIAAVALAEFALAKWMKDQGWLPDAGNKNDTNGARGAPVYVQMHNQMQQQAQQTADKVKQSMQDMQNGVTTSVTTMSGNVVQAMNQMNTKGYTDTQSFTSQAIAMFQNMGTQGQQIMQTLDQNVIGYWNDVAAYIANHPINGVMNIDMGPGTTYSHLSPGLQKNYFASGVTNAPGGWAVVGENGPELMYVPQGSNIYPTGTGPSGGGSRSGSGGGHIFNINITARPQDESEMEQVARYAVTYFGDAIRGQYGNV